MHTVIKVISSILCLPFKIYDWIQKTFFTLNVSKLGPVFVTGCDTGFGHHLAIKLVQNGIHTFAGCLTENGENELRKVAGGGPGKLWTVRIDVTSQQSVDRAADFVRRTLGHGKGLWGLVNNAGVVGKYGPDDWLNVDDYQRAMDVNFLGVVRATQAFKPLVKLERGRVVTMTSIFGRLAVSTCGPYCASKYATEAYCDVLRRELRPFGVTVHIVEPTFFATDMTKPSVLVDMIRSGWEKLSPELKENYGDEYIKGALSSLQTSLPAHTHTNLSLVVDDYYHALTSMFPRQRYYVGLDAKVFYVPLSLLHGCVQDWILNILLKINGVPQPKVAAKKGRCSDEEVRLL